MWEDGERERFTGTTPPPLGERAEERAFERFVEELDKLRPLRAAEIARLGDDKLGELADELGPTTCDVAMMKLLLGRLGEAFVANAVTIVRAAPRERGLFEAAMPIRSPDLARSAAAIFSDHEVPAQLDKGFAPGAAEAWMLRHPLAVAAGLAPLAEDEANAGYYVARSGLAFVASHGGMPAMREVLPPTLVAWLGPFESLAALKPSGLASWALVLAARGMNSRAVSLLEKEPAARAFIERVREGDEKKKLEAVPEAVAPLPPFFDLAELSRPKLSDGTALPDDALRALGEMLRFSPLLNPYVGVEQVRAACDAESLDRFALDVLARWRAAGEDPRDLWALETCGKVGGDMCAREMASCIRGWARGATAPRHGWDQDSHRVVVVEPGSRGWAYARTGCAVLAALPAYGRMHLDDLARTGVQMWLRKEARRCLGGEELSQNESEAQVPTFGLDPDGSATFDVGTHVYKLGFDEGLTPFLLDETGARFDAFPRSKKDMDPVKYAAAKERFTTMVKDVKTVARYQVALLDQVMCERRTYDARGFLSGSSSTHSFVTSGGGSCGSRSRTRV